jgi:hypothetical protein
MNAFIGRPILVYQRRNPARLEEDYSSNKRQKEPRLVRAA